MKFKWRSSSILLYTSFWGMGVGLPYLTERSSVCDFDRTVKFLSNDSQILATYAEVLKHNVKFNMPENIIL